MWPRLRGAGLPFVPGLLLVMTNLVMADDSTGVYQLIRTGPGLSLHKELFMLPATFSDEYDGAQTEAVFQMSAKYRLFNTSIYFAYTQISFWQAYDHDNSAPFRETNYNPELFFRTKRFRLWRGQAGADFGAEHESNGQRLPLSRSWNLLYVCPYFTQANWLVYLKLRYRVPEDDKTSPEDALGDDNPDITDYLGHSDLHLFCRPIRNQTLHVMLRGNFRTGRGGVTLTYSVPVPRGAASLFVVRLSHGYGESLVDYRKSLTRVGLGIMFAK